VKRALVPLLAAALLTGATPTGSDRYRRPCTWLGSKTIYRDHAVRVFTRYVRRYDETRTYACLYASNQRRRIAVCPLDSVDALCAEISVSVAKSPWIGYSSFVSSKGYRQDHACVLNLRSGRGRCEEAHTLIGLGITRAGSLAWVDEGRGRWTINAAAADAARPVVLDSGPEVDSSSFAVGGRHVYWTHDGEPRMATLR